MKKTKEPTTDQRAKEALKAIKADPKLKGQVDTVLRKLIAPPKR